MQEKELFDAIRENDAAAVARLLDADPSLLGARQNGITPILFAVYNGHAELAQLFLDRGATLTFGEACALGRVELRDANAGRESGAARFLLGRWIPGRRAGRLLPSTRAGAHADRAWRGRQRRGAQRVSRRAGPRGGRRSRRRDHATAHRTTEPM